MSTITEYLDSNDIVYSMVEHATAYTAQQTAQAAHIPGRELAKTLVIKLDGKLALVVLPADVHLDIEAIAAETGAKEVELAREHEFADRFSQCELGAMPPFGNIYNMDTYVGKSLAKDEEIAFNACNHTELVRMKYKDWELLVHPKVLKSV